jgi:hypothetical protein
MAVVYREKSGQRVIKARTCEVYGNYVSLALQGATLAEKCVLSPTNNKS